MATLLRIAVRNLLLHRRRNGLLAAAIALVTALLVTLLGLSAGMNHTMLRAATTLATGHVNVAGFYKITSGSAGAVLLEPEALRALINEHVDGVDYIIDRVRGFSRVVSDTASFQTGVYGVNIDQERGLKQVLKLAPRSSYEAGGPESVEGNIDELGKPDTILIFADQAERLGVRVGDTITLSTPTWRGVYNSVDLRVVAVCKNVGFMSAYNVYIPAETLRRVYQLTPAATGAIQIYLDDARKAREVESVLRRELAKTDYRLMEPQSDPFWMKLPQIQGEDWTGQKIDVTTWEDEISFMLWTVDTFDALSVVLVSVLLVLIVVGILNTLWIAVRERTSEIGTMRAIGMSRARVASLIFVEAGVLGAVAAIVGALAAGGIAATVNAAEIEVSNKAFQLFVMSDTLGLLVKPSTALSSAITIAIVTTVAAVAPAVRAARMRPVTAMHHVG
jgi:ABC-type lipoprotein release transport system permease subunit